MNVVPSITDTQAEPMSFPLPQWHRRLIACAAVAASIALGSLGVAATVETVQHDSITTVSATR